MEIKFDKENLKKQIKNLPDFKYGHHDNKNDYCYWCKKTKKLRADVVKGVLDILEGHEVKT